MNKEEAKQILEVEIESFRVKSYAELVKMIDAELFTQERTGSSGKWYQISIQAFWDDKPHGNLRVIGSIDDGGLRAFIPLNEGFIKSRSNTFVGETE